MATWIIVATWIVGLYVLWLLCIEALTILNGFVAFFLAPMGISRVELKKCGKWAVVTGASEGIGKGYAMELARQGLNVMIMSRSEEKLQSVAKEISEKYGCEVRIVVVDFSHGQDIYQNITEELKNLDIGILVNNVGVTYKHPDFFADTQALHLRKIIELNCQTIVQMTKLVLPKMVSKNRGVIVNISSAAGFYPTQLLAVYSASKVFVKYFSDALHKEYSQKGIYVQAVMPYLIATSMTGRKASYFIPDSTAFARSAVATIGFQNTTVGCFSHALIHWFTSRMPFWMWNKQAWSTLLSARARALKKHD